MQRLIKDAARLDSSIDANSMSFANIVKAINVVQTEMGITGTTALEAGRTIEGSVNSMKSAWTNLVTGFADKNADLEGLINNLVVTIVGDGTENNLGVIGNVLPAVKTALSGASRLVSELFPKIVAEVPAIINENLPVIAKAAVGIIESLVKGISKSQKSLSKTALQTITYLAKSFVALLPDIVKLGLEIVVSLAEGIADTDSLDKLVPAVLDTIFKIVEVLTDPNSLSDLLRAAIKIVTKLGELLIREDVLSKLIDCSVQIIVSICDFIANNVGVLVSAAVEIITSLVEYLNDPEVLKDLAEAALEILLALGSALASSVESLAEPISEVISFIASEFFGIDLTEQGKEAIKSFVKGLLSVTTSSPLLDWLSKSFEVDGSHRNGLSYVPYDGYVAELHKGERVLTASEAKGYGNPSVTNNITINVEGYNAQDNDELAEIIAEKLQVMTERKDAVFA